MIAQLKMTHVPYKSSGPALVDLMAGHVHLNISDMSALFNFVNAGKLGAVAVTSSKRNSKLPDVRTVAQTLPGYEAEARYGVLAPARTPAPIVSTLHEEIGKAVRTADLSERPGAQGLDPIAGSPQEFLTYMQREISKRARSSRASGAKLD